MLLVVIISLCLVCLAQSVSQGLMLRRSVAYSVGQSDPGATNHLRKKSDLALLYTWDCLPGDSQGKLTHICVSHGGKPQATIWTAASNFWLKRTSYNQLLNNSG
ncbi:hypothetical protein AVEN_130139-1 [Araneus ventricosus]|uniref:Uncharacterized protein n=1 Tax=Araneus ventricosus TaxID=182803 RepID=A0A4Y2J5J6_ARAVE|nr:hypothetical protein AVEN_130139-1 [Araneus ventricosus]